MRRGRWIECWVERKTEGYRFALTESGQRDKWELLGIEPIDYDPADCHRALADGLKQWVQYERRGFLEWSQRLPAIVGREPRALAPDEHGELEYCLKNPRRAKLFYKNATDPGWLDWAEEHDLLQPLFSFEDDQEPLRDLALWFTEDPLGPKGKVALKIILKALRPVGEALSALASQQVLTRRPPSVPRGTTKKRACCSTSARMCSTI